MENWREFTKTSQWNEYIRKLLATNEKALCRAIMLIYDNQTKEEKIVGRSISHNAKGFSRWDSEEMSDIARKLKRGEKLLSNEIIHSRLVMPKYWKQLMEIAKDKQKIEIEAQIREDKQMQDKQHEQTLKVLKRCSEDNIPCSYGLCGECPNTLGINRSDSDDE